MAIFYEGLVCKEICVTYKVDTLVYINMCFSCKRIKVQESKVLTQAQKANIKMTSHRISKYYFYLSFE